MSRHREMERVNSYTYTVLHEKLTPMGKIKSHKEINVGDEIAFGINHLRVVAGDKREIVVIKIGEVNVVELYDMKMNKVEFNY